MRAVTVRAACAGIVGLALATLAGCSGEAVPTEEGRQADMKALQDSAAANDAAAAAVKKHRPKSNVGVMPP